MTSEYTGNNYQPYSIGMLDGNFTDPYAGMASWSFDNPATNVNPAIAGLDISQTMPTNLIVSSEYISFVTLTLNTALLLQEVYKQLLDCGEHTTVCNKLS